MSYPSVLDNLDRLNGPVAVVGSMNADYTIVTERLPRPGETLRGGPLQILPGGKSANQAVTAAKLGANVQLFGALGEDKNADFLLAELQKAGVDTSQIVQVPGPSGTTVITVDAQGENTIVYSPGSNDKVTVDYLEERADELVKHPVLGLCLEAPSEVVIASAWGVRDAGGRVLLNNSPFDPILLEGVIESTDILLVNEHEMLQLLRYDPHKNWDWEEFDWYEARGRMFDYGYEQAIITLGAKGSVVFNFETTAAVTRINPVKVNAVDTTGCGDSFMGTVLAGLASGLELEESAELGSYVAAYAATRHGAQASYGTVAEIKEFYRAQAKKD